MTELSRGEKARQTRINRIGLEAYKAEQAAKGRRGGAKSVGQFKANPELARAAGKRSKRPPMDTEAGNFEEHGDTKPTPGIPEITDEQADIIDQNISNININRTKR